MILQRLDIFVDNIRRAFGAAYKLVLAEREALLNLILIAVSVLALSIQAIRTRSLFLLFLMNRHRLLFLEVGGSVSVDPYEDLGIWENKGPWVNARTIFFVISFCGLFELVIRYTTKWFELSYLDRRVFIFWLWLGISVKRNIVAVHVLRVITRRVTLARVRSLRDRLLTLPVIMLRQHIMNILILTKFYDYIWEGWLFIIKTFGAIHR